MLGWWDPRCPVACTEPHLHATVYRKANTALVSIGSWADTDVKTHVQIDWDALGLNPELVRVSQPAVKRVQEAATYTINGPIPVAPTRGALLIFDYAVNLERNSCQ